MNKMSKCELCGEEISPPFRVIYTPTKAYVCKECAFNHKSIPIEGHPGWVESPQQLEVNVKRWLENDDGCIISVVDMNYKKPSRLGIDGEIRCSLSGESFAIPCTLDIVNRKSSAELIRLVKRHQERRKE